MSEHRYHPDAARQRSTDHSGFYEVPDEDTAFEDWDDAPLCHCGDDAELTYGGEPSCARCAIADHEDEEADRKREDMKLYPEDY